MIPLSLLLLAAAQPELPAWMAGCWEHRSGERWTEECWTIPRAGMMMGSGRSGSGEVMRDWETMQIVLDAKAGMAFWGAPKGQGRTAFSWTKAAEPGLTFVNPGHDYPQRIRYWREGEELVAEVSLLDGSKPSRWRYQRMGAGD